MKIDELDYAAPSWLYRFRDYMAKKDEYSAFDPICSETDLTLNHAGVLEVMDKNVSMNWNEKLWCYLEYVCILGAKNYLITLCRTSFMKKPLVEYEMEFIKDIGEPQHKKAKGIYIATRKPNERAFPVPDDDIRIEKATHILIKVPKEEVETIFCRAIMLKFILPCDVKSGHLKDMDLMHHFTQRPIGNK